MQCSPLPSGGKGHNPDIYFSIKGFACNYCSDNYVGALGANMLANALKSNKGIRELSLRGNELGDEGIKALCSSLAARETPLTHLDIANNKYAIVYLSSP